MDATDTLVGLLQQPDAYPVFLTGAGISLASGIPTFRGSDPDAVWATDVLEMGKFRFFQQNPTEQWLWYLRRFDVCRGAQPNAAHQAIVDIEQALLTSGRKCLTITQNIDGLHETAGTKNLIQIHGSAHRVRCSRRGCEFGEPHGSLPWDDAMFVPFRANPCLDTVPRCPKCHKLLRAHVLWFDELYAAHNDYGFDAARAAAFEATCVIFVGTSFSVGITDMAVNAVTRMGLPSFVVDPFIEELPFTGATLVREPSEVFLPRVAARVVG